MSEGYTVTEQVKIYSGPSTRYAVVDFVFRDRFGNYGIVDAKAGMFARLTQNQKELFRDVYAGRAVYPSGERAREAGFQPGQAVIFSPEHSAVVHKVR